MSVSVLNHPLIGHKLAQLRDKSTNHEIYRLRLNEIGMLMAAEVFKDLAVKPVSIETPLETTQCNVLVQAPVIVPVLRAALGICEGFWQVCPEALGGHIGLARDEQTLEPSEYLVKLPVYKGQPYYLLDPMLATGNSAVHAVDVLIRHGVPADKITFVSLLAAPEGIENLANAHGAVKIITCSLDRQLNEKGYILPGLGDAGDRLFGTGHA